MISKISFLLKAFLAALAMNMGSSHLCLAGPPVVTQFSNSTQSYQIGVACDNNSNAVAVLNDNTGLGGGDIRGTHVTGTGAWAAVVTLSGVTTSSDFDPFVAMDATGTAIAIWDGVDASSNKIISSALYSGGSWTTPTPNPVYSSTNNTIAGSVAMNGSGQGLAMWTASNILASFYTSGSPGVWSAPVIIGTAFNAYSGSMKASYSSNGDASAIWLASGTNSIYANTYNGTSWGPPAAVLLENHPASLTVPDAGIDSNGNTIAVWSSTPSRNIVTRRFNGTSWSLPYTLSLSTGTGNIGSPVVAVASDGTAVAVWTDSGNNIQMNQFDGSTWSAPIFIVANGQNPQIEMDAYGNALIGWSSTLNTLSFGRLLKGKTALDDAVFINSPAAVTSLNLALSSTSQVGFAVWCAGEQLTFPETYGASYAFPLPQTPTGLSVQVCSNRLAGETSCINTITWDASTDPDVVSFALYANSVLIYTVPSTGSLSFVNNVNCQDTIVYDLYALYNTGLESDPATVTVTFVCSPAP